MSSFIIENGVLVKYSGSDSTVIIPNGITSIGQLAFNMNSSCKEIILPDSVSAIAENGFQCCYQVERIVLPKSLATIGRGAFNNCPCLTEIEMSDGIKEIPDSCFFACTKLERISLPSSIERIGREAFSRCALRGITIPVGAKTIDDQAFFGCWHLCKVVLPSTIEKIGSLAFGQCKYLPTSTIFIPQNADIAYDAFSGCCKFGYREIHCIIECEDYSEQIYVELKDAQTLEDLALEKATDLLVDEYQDLIDTALDEYTFIPDEQLNIYVIGEKLYSAAKDYLKENAKKIMVRVRDLDEGSNVIEFSLFDVLDLAIDSRQECEAFYCDVGRVVENSLGLLESQGAWRFGLKKGDQIITDIGGWPSPCCSASRVKWIENEESLEPVLWFGITSKPIPPLLLSYDTLMDNLTFWNESDANEIMKALVYDDDIDAFLIWYFYECGNCGLDVDTIRAQCPISISSADTAEDIRIKIDTLFLNEYNSFHNIPNTAL